VSSTYTRSRKVGTGRGAPAPESNYSDLSEITPASDAAIGGAVCEVLEAELFSVPEPSIPRRPSGPVLLAKRRQAVDLELEKLHEERKNKWKNKAQHRCRLCKITCNSRRAYQDHIQSRKHKKGRNWTANRAVTLFVVTLNHRPTTSAILGENSTYG
jgi:Zinc-finger of C2H2 type